MQHGSRSGLNGMRFYELGHWMLRAMIHSHSMSLSCFFYYDFNTCLWFLMISNDLGKERWRGCEGPRSRGYSAKCCWMFRLSGHMFDEDNLFWSVLVEFVTRSQEWDGGGVSHATITYNYIQLHTITYNYTYNYIQLHTFTYNYIQLHTITYNYIQLPKKATFCHPSHPR